MFCFDQEFYSRLTSVLQVAWELSEVRWSIWLNRYVFWRRRPIAFVRLVEGFKGNGKLLTGGFDDLLLYEVKFAQRIHSPCFSLQGRLWAVRCELGREGHQGCPFSQREQTLDFIRHSCFQQSLRKIGAEGLRCVQETLSKVSSMVHLHLVFPIPGSPRSSVN